MFWRETLWLQSCVSTSQPRVVRHSLLEHPPESGGGVPRRSWCCELGSFSRRCPLQRNRRAVWSEVKGHMGGVKLTLTCRGETHRFPTGHRHLGQPSPGDVTPFIRNIGESLGIAQCPYGHENKKESVHNQSPLCPGKSSLCPFKLRNAERGRKFGMIGGDESVHSSPSPPAPGALRGLVHQLVCLLSSQPEKKRCWVSISRFKKKKTNLKNKVPYSSGECSRKPGYFN